jgi:hypothetical protein
VRVEDIYAEAADYLGTNDQTSVFRILGRACEYLANKGDWDVLKGYVDLPVQYKNLVVLPWQVDVPLKFTINNSPAFSKDRLYEFTLNGFGSAPGSDRTDLAWEDRGFVPTNIVPPSDPPFHVQVAPSAADAGKRVFIQGQDVNCQEITDTLVISATEYVRTSQVYIKLTEVNKDRTQGKINLYTSPLPPQLPMISGRNWFYGEGPPVIVSEPPPQGCGGDVYRQTALGDFYVDRKTLDVYHCQLTTEKWLSGAGPPSAVVGASGDFYLDTVTLDIYQCQCAASTQVLPPNSSLIASYYPQEINPRYRLIRLSQTGYTARFLFRRKTFRIYSMDDFIPIQSELGLLTMLQAIQGLRRKDMEIAKAMADAAVEITTDAQRATTGFIELANNTEVQEARNYQIYNRDSVIVLDIFDDVAKILGNVGQNVIFDAITTALEVLCAKGHWDGFVGYCDIQTDGWRNVTLPRFVDQPVSISVNGRPAYMRNKWSEFHLNGPGADEYGGQWMGGVWPTWSGFSGGGRWGQIRAWDSIGEVCTIKPLKFTSQLVAIPDDPRDDGKTITIYGYDEDGKWIRTNGQDGFVVVVDHNKVLPDLLVDQNVSRIDRITRDATQGFVRLVALDNVTRTRSLQLGYYYPDETEPRYFRIKLPFDATWIRLRYRKRTLKVTSVWQPLHLYSRTAIITMCRALKVLENDAASAQVYEDKATKFLDEDQKARNPGEVFQMQFLEDCGWNSNYIVS